MGGDQSVSSQEPARCPAGKDQRVISDIVHVLKVGWCDYPADLRATDDNLRPVQPLVAPRLLAQAARHAGGCRRGDEEHGDRQYLHQGATRGIRRKKGRQTQTIGRSRGGWTTKAHALTYVIGPPLCVDADRRHVSASLPTKVMMPTGCAARSAMPDPSQSFPAGATGNESS